MFVEFFDIAQKYLGVDFFLAVEMEINRAFAEFSFPGDAFYSNRFEPLFKKQPSSCLKDRIPPIIPFSFPSLFPSQVQLPSVVTNRVHSADGLRVTVMASNTGRNTGQWERGRS